LAKKKPTKKDIELQIYELHLRVNQLNHYLNGVAEILNKFIDFSGKSKKFYDTLKDEIDKKKESDNGAIKKE
tara:strand:+ start:882 stop:1097 length:216 start_codon:yes stop_codon:yes gene_type:complete